MTDKAGAGVVISSLVQGRQVLDKARLGVIGHLVQSFFFFTSVIAPSHYEVVPHLYTTGMPKVLGYR